MDQRALGRVGLVVLVALAVLIGAAPETRAIAGPAAAVGEVPDPEPGSYQPGVVHVKFKRGVASSGQVARYRAQATRELAPGLGAMSLPVATGTEAQVIRELRADPSVQYVEPNYYLTIADAFPNDARFYDPFTYDRTDPAQVDAHNVDEIQRQWIFRLPQVAEAWSLAKGNPDTIIATIDTGAYLNHPDLAGRLLPGANFVEGEEGNKNEQDNNGHGTAVAGILVANQNNGQYLAGVNWRAKVMPIKAFNDQGSTTVAPIIKAIQYASSHGVKIVNMSLSYTRVPVEADKVAAFQDAIVLYLYSRNITVVGAMGNFGQNPDRSTAPLPPANFDSVIAVGATNYRFKDGEGKPLPVEQRREELSVISNRGPWMSVTAPGQDVRVLYGFPSSDCGQKDDQGHDKGFFCDAIDKPEEFKDYAGTHWASGSSFATPIATGVAALILGCHPAFTPQQVRTVLESSADKIGTDPYPDGRNDFFGHGRVNGVRAVAAANTLTRVTTALARPAAEAVRIFLPLGPRNLVDPC